MLQQSQIRLCVYSKKVFTLLIDIHVEANTNPCTYHERMQGNFLDATAAAEVLVKVALFMNWWSYLKELSKSPLNTLPHHFFVRVPAVKIYFFWSSVVSSTRALFPSKMTKNQQLFNAWNYATNFHTAQLIRIFDFRS